MKKFLAIIYLAVISLLLPAASTVDAKVPDVVSEQKNAVVTVYVQDKSGNHIFEAGGFIVDRTGVVVTSCRAIAKWFSAVENVLHVETGEGLDFPIQDLISSRCDNNLALFRVRQTGLPAVRIAPDFEMRKGKEIFVIGRTSGSGIGVSEGTLKDVYEKDRVAQITVPLTPEMSGSPVFNLKGEAVGAAISLPKKGKSLNVSVSLKGVAKQLARYRKLVKIKTPAAIPAPGEKPAPERVEKHLEPKKKADEGAGAANAYFQRGCDYQELNMHKEAVKEYQQSVKIKPDFAEAYANLGLAYYKLGKYSDAIDAYNKAIKIRPDVVSLYVKLGATYLINGAYSTARDTLKKAVDIDPNDAVAHYNLGIAYLMNGETTGAFREYLILKDLDTERANSLKDLL